jgi:hypothetical protein
VIGFALLVVHRLALPTGLGRTTIRDHKARNSDRQHTRNPAICKLPVQPGLVKMENLFAHECPRQ